MEIAYERLRAGTRVNGCARLRDKATAGGRKEGGRMLFCETRCCSHEQETRKVSSLATVGKGRMDAIGNGARYVFDTLLIPFYFVSDSFQYYVLDKEPEESSPRTEQGPDLFWMSSSGSLPDDYCVQEDEDEQHRASPNTQLLGRNEVIEMTVRNPSAEASVCDSTTETPVKDPIVEAPACDLIAKVSACEPITEVTESDLTVKAPACDSITEMHGHGLIGLIGEVSDCEANRRCSPCPRDQSDDEHHHHNH